VLVQALEHEVIETCSTLACLLDELEQRWRAETIAIEADEKVAKKRAKPSRAMTQKSSP